MNCKMCGAELSKPGELCNNCMNKLMKEQELKNDKSVVAVVKGTYNAKYEIIRHAEQIGVVLLAVILLITTGYWKVALVGGAFFAVVGIISLFIIRAKIRSKSCTIYRSKVVIQYGVLKKKVKEIPFTEIIDMYPHISTFQNLMHVGTFVIRKNNFGNRFEYIESVKDIEEVYAKIKAGLGIEDTTAE